MKTARFVGVAMLLAFAAALTSRPSGAQGTPMPYGPAPAAPYGQAAPGPYGSAPGPGAPPYGAPQAPYGPVGPASPQPMQSATNGDDDGARGLELAYVRLGLGGAFASLDAFSGTDVMLRSLSGVGGAFEVGAGVRLLILTVGPRARGLVLSSATLWQLGGELALRVPLGRWDPFVGLEGGYTFGRKAHEDLECGRPMCDGGNVGISGGDVGLAGGVDYYFTPMVSVGGKASVSMLFLSREAVPQSGVLPPPALADSASMTGLAATLGVHGALHF